MPNKEQLLTETPEMKIEAVSKARETLPQIGKPMIVITDETNAQNPGVEAIDRNKEISWEQLVFVRTTDIAPKIHGETLVIQTPYSGTEDKPINKVDPRTTSHWAVNHHVRANAGDWNREGAEELPYIIVTPAKGLVETNGKPKNFGDVDTFWDKDLILPEGTVVIRRADANLQIPIVLKDKIHIVNRDSTLPAENDVADILKRINFTPIKGGKNYSKTDGVSESFNDFAEKENLESGVHQFDETNRFENKYSQLDDSRLMLNAIAFFTSPNFKPANEQIEKLLQRKLSAIAQADIETVTQFYLKNKISEAEARELFDQAKTLLNGKI